MSALLRGAAAVSVALLLVVPPTYADDAAAPATPAATAIPTPTPSSSPAEETTGAGTGAPAGASTAGASEPASPTAPSSSGPTPSAAAPSAAPSSAATPADIAPKPSASAGATSANPAPTKAQAAAACVDGPVVTLGASTATLGGTLHVTGTGWCTTDHTAGSTIAFKLDAGGVSRVDATVHANRTIWAIVQAAADGSFAADLTLPDGTAATSTPVVAAGGPHSFTLLTGSLGPDPVRSVTTSTFDLLAPDANPNDGWGFPLATGTATAWIQRAVTTTEGTLRIAGTGWLTGSGAPSTIAVKLNASDSTQFQRSTDIQQNDPTIWALFTAGSDGAFDRELELPAGLTGGQYLTVRLASGKFGAGDTQRSLLSPLLAVDGATYTAPEDGAGIACHPTTTAAAVTVTTPTVPLGGTVTVSGAGWCNPAGGGSRIGVKIDDGAISHLDSTVHSNRTIWAIVQADHATGTFTATIALPDGTTRTSTPALANGAHTLRFLSGSLRAGDTIRSLDAGFVVGTYRPNGSPDPLADSALAASTRHGLTAKRTASGRLRVTLPGSPAGTWVFLSAYVADGSPRYPWSDRWLRLDARRGVTLRIPASAPTGEVRLVAQSGEQGEIGRLLGWARVTLRPVVARTVAAVAPVVALPAAVAVVPARPASSYAGLTRLSQHAATAVLTGTIATLTFPETSPGDTLFLTVYDPARAIPGGWVTVDERHRVRADLRSFGPTDLRVVAQTSQGELAGWAQVALAPPAAEPGTAEAPGPTAAGPVPEAAAARSHLRPAEDAPFISAMDGWLLGLGALVLAGTGLALRVAPTRKARA